MDREVLIEWRTTDKWCGVQQRIKRKSIDPEGPLAVGQKIKVKFGRGSVRHDALAVESWSPVEAKSTLLSFLFLFMRHLASLSNAGFNENHVGKVYSRIAFH